MNQKQSLPARARGEHGATYWAYLATAIAGSLVTLIVTLFPIPADAFSWFSTAKADTAPLPYNPEDLDLPSAVAYPEAETSDIAMTDGSALIPSGGPDGSLPTENGSSGGIFLYLVREGDSLSGIADMFDVTTNTILWANDIKNAKTIQPGDTLLILPVSGVRYTIKSGGTLADVAKKFDADLDEIALYNGIDPSEPLKAGTEIIVPGGDLNHEEPKKAVAKKSSGGAIPAAKTAVSTPSGYYGNPLPGAYVSQGIHGNNGVDLAGMPKGSTVSAAAAGTVIVAKADGGYNGGYGNYVVVKHDNGTQTLYAHLSSVSVAVGDTLSKGEALGGVGNTGRSTGIHLHFEVRGAKNPFAN